MTREAKWLVFLGLLLLVAVVLITDRNLYDGDLERQHINETGYSWEDMEK